MAALNIIYSHLYIGYLEWVAITLWSIESLPQIYLNFFNKSTRGLSNLGQILACVGKTTDVINNYTLLIPTQYRVLAFLSTSSAYLGNLQVLHYISINQVTKKFDDKDYSKLENQIEESGIENKEKMYFLFKRGNF